MSLEIERKFLVRDESFITQSKSSSRITQGYIATKPGRTVRIRTRGNRGFITIKGNSTPDGLSRYEWEKEIPLNEALELLELCEEGRIDKVRHLVDYKGHTFEVDVFHGDNEGLVLAEVELGCEDEVFEKPDWLAEEVTGDPHYYNKYLSRHPFTSWEE